MPSFKILLLWTGNRPLRIFICIRVCARNESCHHLKVAQLLYWLFCRFLFFYRKEIRSIPLREETLLQLACFPFLSITLNDENAKARDTQLHFIVYRDVARNARPVTLRLRFQRNKRSYHLNFVSFRQLARPKKYQNIKKYECLKCFPSVTILIERSLEHYRNFSVVLLAGGRFVISNSHLRAHRKRKDR